MLECPFDARPYTYWLSVLIMKTVITAVFVHWIWHIRKIKSSLFNMSADTSTHTYNIKPNGQIGEPYGDERIRILHARTHIYTCHT